VFQLPQNCPGVFEASGNSGGTWSASIRYKLKAIVAVRGMFKSNIKHTVPLVVRPLSTRQATPPQRVDSVLPVVVCCCCNKGTASLSVTTDKFLYAVGETANVVADFRNESTKPIGTVKCSLVRDINLRAHGRVKHVSSVEVAAVHPGLGAGAEALGRYMPLTLVGRSSFSPSTRGFLLECSYSIVVSGSISMGSNLHLRIPIVLTASDGWSQMQGVTRYDQAPPGWNATAPPMAQPVSFQLPEIAAPTPTLPPYQHAPMGTADGGFSRIDDTHGPPSYQQQQQQHPQHQQQQYQQQQYQQQQQQQQQQNFPPPQSHPYQQPPPPPQQQQQGGYPPSKPDAPPPYDGGYQTPPDASAPPKPKFDPQTGKPL
jgi:hypothetical protein